LAHQALLVSQNVIDLLIGLSSQSPKPVGRSSRISRHPFAKLYHLVVPILTEFVQSLNLPIAQIHTLTYRRFSERIEAQILEIHLAESLPLPGIANDPFGYSTEVIPKPALQFSSPLQPLVIVQSGLKPGKLLLKLSPRSHIITVQLIELLVSQLQLSADSRISKPRPLIHESKPLSLLSDRPVWSLQTLTRNLTLRRRLRPQKSSSNHDESCRRNKK
jgi:hypothetical protein